MSQPSPLGGGRLRWALLAAAALYLLVPFVATALYSVATVWRSEALPDGYTLRWWGQTLTSDRLLAAGGRSLLLACGSVLVINLLVLPPLYWSRIRAPRIRTVMQLCAVLPFALPFLVIAYGIRELAALSPLTAPLQTSTLLLFLGHVAIAFPFYLWSVDAAMSAAGVERLHEAAEASGAGPATTLLRVILPNVKVGVVAGSLLAFATSIGEFSVARLTTGAAFETLPLWQVAQIQDTHGNPNGLAVVTLATFGLLFAISIVLVRLGGGQPLRLLPGARASAEEQP
jgi:putative spermidine/putrescine transport system permease protein